jgi:hypothetical protein
MKRKGWITLHAMSPFASNDFLPTEFRASDVVSICDRILADHSFYSIIRVKGLPGEILIEETVERIHLELEFAEVIPHSTRFGGYQDKVSKLQLRTRYESTQPQLTNPEMEKIQ